MKKTELKLQRHFKLFKPYGYLSQFASNARHQANSKFLGDLFDFPPHSMAVGRLDKDSEGLLLVTTDGQLSHHINSNSIEKEYWVQVDGDIPEKAIETLKSGIQISGEGKIYGTKACKVYRLHDEPILPNRIKPIRTDRHGPTSWISITITEGKFRQVRKMTAAVGYPTLRLVRIRIGTHHLDSMQPKEVVELESLL